MSGYDNILTRQWSIGECIKVMVDSDLSVAVKVSEDEGGEWYNIDNEDVSAFIKALDEAKHYKTFLVTNLESLRQRAADELGLSSETLVSSGEAEDDEDDGSCSECGAEMVKHETYSRCHNCGHKIDN